MERWPAEAPSSLRAGVDLAQRLEAAGNATPDGAILRIQHYALARLTAHEASLLGLSPAAEANASIVTGGLITQPGFKVTLRWRRPTGQAILGWNAQGLGWRSAANGGVCQTRCSALPKLSTPHIRQEKTPPPVLPLLPAS